MAGAEWAEIATDAPWNPWLLKQVRATLEGHENGEAVAIEAVTIDDTVKPAGRWKNLGGAGAAVWEDASGSKIGEALDTAFNVYKPFSGAGASFSGAVSVASLAAVGAVTAASVAASGAVSGASGSFSGAVSVGSLTSAGAISAFGATITGPGAGNDQALFLRHNVGVPAFGLGATNSADPSLVARDASGNAMAQLNPSGSTYALDVNPEGVITGALNAARFTGDVLITTALGVAGIANTAGYSGTTGSFSGAVSVGSLSSSGAVSGTNGTFSGDVTANDITASDDLTAGGDLNVGSVLNHDGSTAGFFSTAPAARKNVIGVLSGSPTLAQLTAVVRSFLSALDQTACGLVIDATT